MLKPLTEIKFPDLISFDRQTMVEEIIDRMKQDPDWNSLFDGELHQNASQMVLQFFAYLFEKNATSINKNIKENFLNQAFSDRAIFDNSAQMRINALQNTEAQVKVVGVLGSGYLTQALVLPKYYKLPAINLNGQKIFFEIFNKSEEGYEYLENVIINPGNYARDSFELTAYSGTTFVVENAIVDELLENFFVTINHEEIIENSIRVYYRHSNGVMIELIKTDTFLVDPYITAQSSTYFPDGVPHYIIRYKQTGTAEILFGSTDFGGAFTQDHVGGTLIVYGRKGGGKAANITPRSIQTTERFYLTSQKTIDVTFTNFGMGTGGSDRETAQQVKQFGPYRYGRQDGHIVDKQDAKVALQQSIVKHEIDTPKFSEINSTVPLLHAHHKIVPSRDFSGFIFPEVLITDTLNSYLSKFLLALNNFLNVSGTHDAAVQDEFVTEFLKGYDELGNEDYNFLYKLVESNPLSGTLKATAWNYKNELVDHIVWEGNYLLGQSTTSAKSQDHAEMASASFETISIIFEKNDRMKFKLNEVDYVFDLELSTGVKTVTELAAELQTRILEKITYDEIPNLEFFQYRTFEFFTAEIVNTETGVGILKLKSPTVGKDSKIELLDNGLNNPDPSTNLYDLLQVEEKVYRPPLGTELTFLPENVYDPERNEINFLINEELMNVDEEKTYSEEWDQDTSQEAGPIISIVLSDPDDPELLQQLQISTDLEITAYDGETAIDYAKVSSVQDSDENAVIFPGTSHPVFKNTYAEANYDYTTSTIRLQLVDGVEQQLYAQSFPIITKVMIRRISGITFEPIDTSEPWETAQWFETEDNWSQDILSSTGPDVEIDVGAEVEDGFAQGNNYEVRIYKQTGESPILMTQIRYLDVDVEAGFQIAQDLIINTTDEVAKGDQDHFYDPATKKIIIKAKDPNEDNESPPYYGQGFADFTKLRFVYKRKSYEYITVDYQPNPYAPGEEAKLYIDKLMSESRRLIGLQNIIKNISFFPIGLELLIYVDKNYSLSDVQNDGESILRRYFEYDNANYEHTIGVELNEDLMRNILNKELTEYGVQSMEFVNASYTESLTEVQIANTYFFFLPDTFIQSILELESTNLNLTGLSDLFKIKITAVRKV